MVLKPTPMQKIAVLGLRKENQIVVSILHDLNVVQLEPLSKDVIPMLRNERDNDLFRQVSDQLLRMKALKTILPTIAATQCQRFTSVDQIMKAAQSIDIDSNVATLEKEKESLLTQFNETENNIKLVEEFSFFPEDFSVFQLKMAHSYFARMNSKNYSAFKKALDVNSQDVFINTKEGKDATSMVLVTFPNFPPHALATIVQEYDVKLEAVPKLDGKADQLIQKLKTKQSEISQKLKEVEKQLGEISKAHYVNIVCVEEQLEIENRKLEVIDNLGVTSDSFALEGWIPKSKVSQLRVYLKKIPKVQCCLNLKQMSIHLHNLIIQKDSNCLRPLSDSILYQKAKNLILHSSLVYSSRYSMV